MSATVLKVEHVTRRFGSGDTEVIAVRDVSLKVSPGEIVLIMGPSGSGKSTLLMMLGALLKPTEGTIAVDGVSLTELSESKLPDLRLHRFGFIFQDFNLLSALNVVDNVALAAELAGVGRKKARARATELLNELGLGHRLRFLPHKLSGGEQQRVAIARALVNNPPVILADEPTANLDSSHGHETMGLLRSIAQEGKRSVIIVSHDQRIKDIADRVLWLEDGEFKEMVEMVTDRVCGMTIERRPGTPEVEWNGESFWFCSKGCRGEFLEAPARFSSRR